MVAECWQDGASSPAASFMADLQPQDLLEMEFYSQHLGSRVSSHEDPGRPAFRKASAGALVCGKCGENCTSRRGTDLRSRSLT